jgi:Tol biopolymer transport system component
MKRILHLVALLLLLASCARTQASTDIAFCSGATVCAGKNPLVTNVRVIQQSGARPRFSPDGGRIVFDRKNADGYYDVYLTDLQGESLVALTEGKTGIGQKNNGNADFDPSGKYILFISEEEKHYSDNQKWTGDPGMGLFSNLWATDLNGERFWKLTDIPIKQSLGDGIIAMATVNPLFSLDGKTLFWTERYNEGGNHNWGLWRIKAADFIVNADGPRLENERVFFTPQIGTYVTALGFVSPTKMILSGNLDGQHEYGMDEYVYDMQTGELQNLTDTPSFWEEDATVTPSGQIIFMSNFYSSFAYDFPDPAWASQKMERDYILVNADGSAPQRLTYFNDPAAPEYLGRPVIVAASDVSPDGRYLVASLGVDFGETRRDMVLKIMLIEFSEPQ